MPDASSITDFAGVIALAAASADAEGAALRVEIRLGVNDVLLRLVDELETEASWRPGPVPVIRGRLRHSVGAEAAPAKPRRKKADA